MHFFLPARRIRYNIAHFSNIYFRFSGWKDTEFDQIVNFIKFVSMKKSYFLFSLKIYANKDGSGRFSPTGWRQLKLFSTQFFLIPFETHVLSFWFLIKAKNDVFFDLRIKHFDIWSKNGQNRSLKSWSKHSVLIYMNEFMNCNFVVLWMNQIQKLRRISSVNACFFPWISNL